MTSNDKRTLQTGSILVVALVSLLTVGIVATALNALIVQDVETFNQKIKAMQNTSLSDKDPSLNLGKEDIYGKKR